MHRSFLFSAHLCECVPSKYSTAALIFHCSVLSVGVTGVRCTCLAFSKRDAAEMQQHHNIYLLISVTYQGNHAQLPIFSASKRKDIKSFTKVNTLTEHPVSHYSHRTEQVLSAWGDFRSGGNKSFFSTPVKVERDMCSPTLSIITTLSHHVSDIREKRCIPWRKMSISLNLLLFITFALFHAEF